MQRPTGPDERAERFEVVASDGGRPIATVEIETNLAGRTLLHVAPAAGAEDWALAVQLLVEQAVEEEERGGDEASRVRDALARLPLEVPALRCEGLAAPEPEREDLFFLGTRAALVKALLEAGQRAPEALEAPEARALLRRASAVPDHEALRALVEELEESARRGARPLSGDAARFATAALLRLADYGAGVDAGLLERAALALVEVGGAGDAAAAGGDA